MPSPAVAAVAVMALLAAGVVLGSVTSPLAQSAGIAPIVLTDSRTWRAGNGTKKKPRQKSPPQPKNRAAIASHGAGRSGATGAGRTGTADRSRTVDGAVTRKKKKPACRRSSTSS